MFSAMNQLRRASARFAAGLAVLAAAFVVPSAAGAATSPQNAAVALTDTGISPASVTIPVGGSVTWTNQGSVTHTAESVGGPSPFNTAGIGPGQSATLAFAVPGVYGYTSGADCLHGTYIQAFTCGNYTIAVVAANGALPTPAVAATPTPVPAAANAPVANASVTISDTAFAPATVNIALNGGVTWTNSGTNVHTATSTPDSVNAGFQAFDTGGLGPGQSSTIGFTTPGTYVYFSTPDCFSKSNPAAFNCAYYTVVVGTTPAPQPQSSQAPGPTATPVNVPGTSTSVTIDDVNGFHPNTLTVKVGQTVGWLNIGNMTHSVVLNQNPQPSQPVPWWLPYQLPSVGGTFFDSGGFAPQQSFSYNFTTPGTFPYHSSTEPIYQRNNPNCSCTSITYKFFGTVVVTP
jgi:plastocyanin